MTNQTILEPLPEDQWFIETCSHSIDRDLNAAINLSRLA